MLCNNNKNNNKDDDDDDNVDDGADSNNNNNYIYYHVLDNCLPKIRCTLPFYALMILNIDKHVYGIEGYT